VEKVPDERRPMTLDEALGMAVLLQKGGYLEQAADVYRQIREAVPDNPDVLHYAGVLAHQQGRHDEAVALIEQSLAINPNRADCHSNLGIVLKAQGRVEEAVAAFRRASELDRANAIAYSILGVLFGAVVRYAESEASYRKALEIDPEHIDAWHNLGVLLGKLGRTKEAVVCYSRVTTLSPRHPQARRLLAMAYCALDQREKAVEIFEEWLREEPDNPIPRHMLPACSRKDVPDRAADGFVETTFDQFAASFEAKLKHLQYQAPALVHAMLQDSGRPADGTLDILDMGCGTGLCGPLLKPFARHLTGVDLSAGMLDLARGKAIYDELVKAELTAHLSGRQTAYDVIVSADTLCYFGVLDGAIGAAAGALKPGGLLIFTVEAAEDDDATEGHVLESHGRYSHTRPYLERVLQAAGFAPTIVGAELRMESGMPVVGFVVCAIRRDRPEGAIYSAPTSIGRPAGVDTPIGARDA
jgi:predicted TPR repeat methyltransferase